MTRWLQVALAASLFLSACGATPTAPASSPPPAPSVPAAPLTLTVIAPVTPFHVGTPGEIRYEVTGVTMLDSLAYSSKNDSMNIGAVMSPAAAMGAVRLTFARPGTYLTTVTATTLTGVSLQVSVTINVVE